MELEHINNNIVPLLEIVEWLKRILMDINSLGIRIFSFFQKKIHFILKMVFSNK